MIDSNNYQKNGLTSDDKYTILGIEKEINY